MRDDVRVQLCIRLPAEERRLLTMAALRCRLSLNDFLRAVLRPVIDEADQEDVAALRRRLGCTGAAER